MSLIHKISLALTFLPGLVSPQAAIADEQDGARRKQARSIATAPTSELKASFLKTINGAKDLNDNQRQALRARLNYYENNFTAVGGILKFTHYNSKLYSRLGDLNNTLTKSERFTSKQKEALLANPEHPYIFGQAIPQDYHRQPSIWDTNRLLQKIEKLEELDTDLIDALLQPFEDKVILVHEGVNIDAVTELEFKNTLLDAYARNLINKDDIWNLLIIFGESLFEHGVKAPKGQHPSERFAETVNPPYLELARRSLKTIYKDLTEHNKKEFTDYLNFLEWLKFKKTDILRANIEINDYSKDEVLRYAKFARQGSNFGMFMKKLHEAQRQN